MTEKSVKIRGESMRNVLNWMNVYFAQIPDFVIRRKWIVWGAFLVSTILVVWGSTGVNVNMSMEVYFKDNDPTKISYNQFRNEFGSDEFLFITFRAKDGDIFSKESLTVLSKIQQELQNYRLKLKKGEKSELDHITDVKSVINANYMEANGNTLYSRPFVGENIPKTKADSDRLRKSAMSHPDYPLLYFSKDSKYGNIFLRTDFSAETVSQSIARIKAEEKTKKSGATDDDEEDDEEGFEMGTSKQPVKIIKKEISKNVQFKATEMDEYSRFTAALWTILNKPEYKKHFEFYPVGNPIIMTFFQDIVMNEMGLIYLGTIAVIMVFLWILFRSFSAVIWPIAIVIFTVLWTVGLIGWFGATVTTMITTLILLLIVVGVADSVHILSGYLYFRNKKYDHIKSLQAVYKKSGLACFLTSLTTSIGLLSLSFVPILPIRIFGISGAIGVLVAFLFTLILIPLMLDLWQPVSKKQAKIIQEGSEKEHLVQKILHKFEPLSYRYPVQVVMVFAVVAGFALYGLSKVRIDSNMTQILKKGTAVRTAIETVNRVMGGGQNLEILVNTGKEDGLKDPRIMNAIEKLQKALENHPSKLVARTSSIVNVTKESNKAFHSGKQEEYRIPQKAAVLSNILFLSNQANPKDRRFIVSDHYDIARVTVSVKNIGSSHYVKLFADADKIIQEVFDPLKKNFPDLKVELTGGMVLMMKLLDYISWSQIQSFSISLVIISILLLFALGTVRVGLLAIIPNLFPIMTTFGIMGLLGIPLDIDTLIIAPIIIGIAVDDTVHFLTHLRAEYLKHHNLEKAIIGTFREVGQAITFTSIVLALGFSTMLFSSHLGLARFGALSAFAITSALLADFFLLPSLCILAKAKFKH
ncbi:MAG: putative RND superfamily exporter protein [bacterium]|jgi:predicted RND superfamily exporter protein